MSDWAKLHQAIEVCHTERPMILVGQTACLAVEGGTIHDSLWS